MDIKKVIQNNPFSAIAIIITLGNMVAGIFLYATANQLQPLYEGQRSLIARVEAIENRNENVDPLVDSFIEVRTDVTNIKKDVAEVKGDVKEIQRDIKNLLNR